MIYGNVFFVIHQSPAVCLKKARTDELAKPNTDHTRHPTNSHDLYFRLDKIALCTHKMGFIFLSSSVIIFFY